jgi:hypothetical protein
MPNVRRQEERHEETLAALTSQNHSPSVVINSQQTSQTSQTSPPPPSPSADYRLQAIRNLKTIGKPFDEFDLELETEKIKKDHEESKRKERAEQEQEELEKRARQEEELRRRQEIENEKRTQLLTKVAIVVGAVLLLAALSFTVVYLLKNGKSAAETSLAVEDPVQVENIEVVLSQLITEWCKAHSLNSTGKLSDLYHSEAFFYGQQLKRDKIYGKKLSALQKVQSYEQKIVGDIDVKYVNTNEYRCDFVKQVTANQKTKDYPSYLIFKRFDGGWKIVVESDGVTDKNLIKRRVNEIRNFPEVRGIENRVVHEFDEDPYVVRVEDMESYHNTIYWFYIYKNPYRIMYYDVAGDVEMTIGEWRRRG